MTPTKSVPPADTITCRIFVLKNGKYYAGYENVKGK